VSRSVSVELTILDNGRGDEFNGLVVVEMTLGVEGEIDLRSEAGINPCDVRIINEFVELAEKYNREARKEFKRCRPESE